MIGGGYATSFMPSTPLAAHQRTHSRAFSGVSTTPPLHPAPGRW